MVKTEEPMVKGARIEDYIHKKNVDVELDMCVRRWCCKCNFPTHQLISVFALFLLASIIQSNAGKFPH